MPEALVTLEIEDAIATVSLNRPDRLNAYGWEMGAAFAEVMEKVAAELDAKARALAAEIAANAPLAVQGTKRTINHWAKRGLDEALEFEAISTATCFVSEDLLEGYASAREKRKT